MFQPSVVQAFATIHSMSGGFKWTTWKLKTMKDVANPNDVRNKCCVHTHTKRKRYLTGIYIYHYIPRNKLRNLQEQNGFTSSSMDMRHVNMKLVLATKKWGYDWQQRSGNIKPDKSKLWVRDRWIYNHKFTRYSKKSWKKVRRERSATKSKRLK